MVWFEVTSAIVWYWDPVDYRLVSVLTRDGTAEPVSRDQILRRERGQRNINFPCSADHTSRIGNLTRLIYTLQYVMTKEKKVLRLHLYHRFAFD